MNPSMPHILVRHPSSPPPRRPTSRELYTGRAVEIYSSGTEYLPVAEDRDGICVIVSDRIGTADPADLLEQSREGNLADVAVADGHFAAFILDKRSESFTVLRDPAGFQHLYYSAHSLGPVLSTDLGWLVREGRLEAKATSVDRTALGLYVAFQYVPAPYTPYQGISQLSPGEVLEGAPDLRTAARECHALVAPDPSPLPDQAGPPPAHVINLLQGSLASGLEGTTGKLGAFLSGGMDTSANIAVLVERLDLRPFALTAAFREPRYDESPYARTVARHYGLQHLEVEIVPKMLDSLPDIVRHFDSPHGDRAAFAQHFLAQAAREVGCGRICTGEGGDEIMGLPRSRDKEETYLQLPERGPELASWYLERTCLASAHWRGLLLAELGLEAGIAETHLAQVHSKYARYSPFERLYFGQWQTWLIDGVYMKDRSVLEGQGIRPVFPFMGTSLMRYMSQLPPEAKRAGLSDKRFVKDGLAESLPAETLNRTKQKFWLPFAEWFRGPARPLLQDTLLASQGFVRAQFGSGITQDLIAEHMAGADHSRLLWALLFLEMWHAEHSGIR